VGTDRNRRRDIVAAARAEFDRHGLVGARVQRIADQAGVNKQLIFYYLHSKLGLYRDVIRSSLSELDAATQDDGGPQVTKRLRHQVLALFRCLSERPHIARLLVSDSVADPDSEQLIETTLSELTDRLVRIVTDGQRLGYFRDDCDADTTARHAVGLVLGHLILERAVPGDPLETSGAAVPDRICRVLLRSLEW
jgi:TetR/AcrR family transcriptional regulator